MPTEPRDAAALFRAHAAYVARILVRAGISASDVEDLVQEVFLVAHRKGGFVEGQARATTWLARIALRVAANHRRKRGRGEVATEDIQVHTDASASEAGLLVARAAAALETMHEDRRLVFVLFELEGIACDAIARELEVPVGTVYSRIHAARAEFKKALGEAG